MVIYPCIIVSEEREVSECAPNIQIQKPGAIVDFFA
jgi:hypothetical protein